MLKRIEELTNHELDKILAGNLTFSIKHFGNKINLSPGWRFTKTHNKPINAIDILVSDIYYKPIKAIRKRGDLINKTISFIHDYINGQLITYDDVAPDEFIKKEDKEIIIPKELLSMGNSELIIDNLNKDWFVTIFVNDENDRPYCKITNSHRLQTSKQTDNTQLLYNDFINYVDLTKLKYCELGNTPEETYINIVYRQLDNYLAKTNYNISNTDFELPNFMKSNINEKGELLIDKPAITNQNIYDFFTILLVMMNKTIIKDNEYLSHQGKIKQNNIATQISDICKGKFELSIPTFYESIYN